MTHKQKLLLLLMVMMLRDDVVVEGKIIFKIILVQNFKLVICFVFFLIQVPKNVTTIMHTEQKSKWKKPSV